MLAAFDQPLRAAFLALAHQRVEMQLAQLPGSGAVEMIGQFAHPLWRTLILDLLGIPAERRTEISRLMRRGLTFAIHDGENLVRYPLVMAGDSRGMREFRREVHQEFTKLAGHSFEPSARGLLPALLRTAQGGSLSLDEVLVLTEEVALSSLERSVYQLGNSLLALAQRPALYQRLRREPDRVTDAIVELERFDPAVQAVFRFAREDFSFHHLEIQAGDPFVLLLGSANRDPRQFRNPDEIDIDRGEHQQFTFGRGSHACIGARIARCVQEFVLTAILTRYRAISPVGRPVWTGRLPMRGLESLTLALEP
jgi:cytochrome P450